MEFSKVIEKRRSIRSYHPTPVTDSQIQEILQAALLAPTADNRQPFKLIVVKKPAEILYFVKQEAIHQAPIAIAIFIDKSQAWVRRYDNENFAFVDGAIVFQQVILAATNQGLATVWIANIDPNLMEEALKVPKNYRFLALTPIGYPAEEPKEISRKTETELISFR
jgi:nitroreductase